jgi:O-antigen ligase
MHVRRQPSRAVPAHIWQHTSVLLLAWGVLTAGGNTPFGSTLPLLAALGLYGAAAVLRGREEATVSRRLGVSIAALWCSVLLQLIPVPTNVLARISPAAMTIARHDSDAAGERDGVRRPLSIDPNATARGLMAVAALGLFFVGMVRTMGRGAARRLAGGLVLLGAAVALVGIAESFTHWRVYSAAGLPLPPDSTPHGPFPNRNHYAGWMLMALAVTIGYLCGLLQQGEPLDRAGHRRPVGARRSWIGQTLAVEVAALAMAVALVQTRSRAGILALSAAVVIMTSLLVRHRTSFKARILIAGPLIVLLVMSVAMTGVQPIVSRFAVDSWPTGHGRLAIWRQAASIARDFPLTGVGLNTYQRVVPFYPSADLDEPYEAAHNDFLQLAAEGGLLVGVPFLAVLGVFALDARRRFREASDGMTRWIRIGAVVGLLVIAAQETVDFSLQVPGNIALFALLAAIAIHRAPNQPRTSWNPRGMPSHAQ